MKHPLESLMTAAGILLLAFLSCLLLPAPSLGLVLSQKLVVQFHLMDLNQLYTLLFCLWFLLLGVVEYFVIRYIWRRWFSLSDAAGDWAAEGLGLGYLNAAVMFGTMILMTATSYYLFRADSVLCFWIAYILTRPFGASCGDLLSQPPANGGIGLGTTGTSVLFLLAIISLIGYLTYRMKIDSLEP